MFLFASVWQDYVEIIGVIFTKCNAGLKYGPKKNSLHFGADKFNGIYFH